MKVLGKKTGNAFFDSYLEEEEKEEEEEVEEIKDKPAKTGNAFFDSYLEEEPTEETVEVSNENQKLEISLSSGQIIKSELLNYPLEINGQANTLLFNKCGKENYFLDGGFVVSGMSNAPEGNYFSVLSKSKDSVEIIRRLPNGSTHSKKISLGENFRINFDEEFFNGEVVEVSVAPYAKINRSSEKTISGSGGIFTQPSSWAYLGPAFSYDGENYDKRSFSEIEELEFRTSTSGGWISMIQHYFLTSLLPNQ